MSLTASEVHEVLRNVMLHKLREEKVPFEAHEMFVEAFNRMSEQVKGATFDSPKVWAFVMQGMSNYLRTIDGQDDKRVV